MNNHNSTHVTIEGELRTEHATAQIVCCEMPGASDHVLRNNGMFSVDMSLTPRLPQARACYPNRWGRHRFDQMGNLFLVPPGEVMHAKSNGGKQTSIVCQFTPDLMSTWIDGDLKWNESRLEAALDIRDDAIRCMLMRVTREVSHPGRASERLLELIASQLAIELGRYCVSVNDTAIKRGLPAWRLRLIEERVKALGKPPTLAELAQLCGLSIRQLTRGFRITCNCTIGEYVEQYRIEHAKRLLLGGESVKAVAYSMGFASLSSFSYTFRRATGTCPRKFKQLNNCQ